MGLGPLEAVLQLLLGLLHELERFRAVAVVVVGGFLELLFCAIEIAHGGVHVGMAASPPGRPQRTSAVSQTGVTEPRTERRVPDQPSARACAPDTIAPSTSTAPGASVQRVTRAPSVAPAASAAAGARSA